MDDLKHNLLLNLADYTDTLHLGLEGKDLTPDERLTYLGHLAMCARIFKSVYLNERVETLEQILKIERASFKFGTPNNERGTIARDAWDLFSPLLQSYVTAMEEIPVNSGVRLSDDAEEFAAALLRRSADLANARSHGANMPPEKYLLIRDFAQSLVFNCYSAVNAKLESERITETQMLDLFWQYLYFFIHVTDRMAIPALSDAARRSLMQELGEVAVTLALQVLCPQEEESLFERAMGGLNLAVGEYSNFGKLMPDASEASKDTLLWEFSKKVNRILGSQTNAGAILGEQVVLTSVANNLDIKSFLAKARDGNGIGA